MGWFGNDCETKPGCPPCNRWRGWGPEWDGDLCNQGKAIVNTKDISDENGTLTVSTIKPSVAVQETIEKTKEKASQIADKVEAAFDPETYKAIFEKIIHGIEIIILCIAIGVLVWGIYKLVRCCFCCYKCCCKPKKRATKPAPAIKNPA